MSQKHTFTKMLIKESQEHIKKIAPWLTKIHINAKRLGPNQGYITKIVANGRDVFLIATKRDETITKSLMRATNALIHQIEKVKARYTKKHLNKMELIDALQI